MSCLTTSATRRSRSVPAAVLIASAAASSHDVLLVPMISVTRYTLMMFSFDHAARCGTAAASLSHRHPGRPPMPRLRRVPLKRAEGLFHQAVTQSGAAAQILTAEAAARVASMLAQSLEVA